LSVTHLFACDGCFVGFPAVASLIIAVVVLIGSIYMLLASNFGLRQGYLILMVSLFGWMLIMSAIWLFGAPGTTPGTGPRAREPQWIPFTATSQVAKEDFPEQVRTFPGGAWEAMSKKDAEGNEQDVIFPGKVDPRGDFETIRTAIKDAEARLAAKNETETVKADDWNFRPEGKATTIVEEDYPEAVVRVQFVNNKVLFGAKIPATVCPKKKPKCATHPETIVFAYRDKGLVFLYALYFLILSGIGFAIHLWLLARLERRQAADTARLEPATA
jgi:hypothetical protein